MSDVEHDFKLAAIRCTHCPARYWVADKHIADRELDCTRCLSSFMLRDAEVICRQGQGDKKKRASSKRGEG